MRSLILLLLVATATVGARADAPDYGLLDAVLLANVRNGYVDYDGIAADPRFRAFTGQLGSASPEDSPAGRLAWYINAYNAFTISAVLDGQKKNARFRLGGADTTLEAIERERILPLADPRVHFALACATLSCPRLWNHAYVPAEIDAQLDDAARRFVNDVTRNRFDIAQKTAFVSGIFERYSDDFAGSGGSVAAWLARYVSEPATRAALVEGRLALAYLPPDKDLNGRYDGAKE